MFTLTYTPRGEDQKIIKKCVSFTTVAWPSDVVDPKYLINKTTLNNYKENNTKIIQKSQRRTLIRNETLKNQVIHHKKVNVGKSVLKINMGHRTG